jgi:iron complex transport system substrate-binding protein
MTRWLMWLMVVMVLVSGACNAGGGQAGTQQPAPEAGQDTSQAAAVDCGRVEGDQRIVEHAMGETAVPVEPERVVVLDTGELDNAFALGVKPVGAVEVSQGLPFASYLLDRVEGIQTVGTIAQPSLEAIAALNPDLILSNTVRHEAIYPQLSQIAPTVLAEGVGVTWKENLRLNAQALGKCEEAEELFASYEERVAAFKRLMGDRLAQTEVSVIRSLPDEVRIYMNASFIGTVLEDVGLPRPPAQDKNVFAEEATIERIPDLDGDTMFLTMFTDDNAQLEQLMANPLWQELEAVKAGRVYIVPDGRWMLGIGMIAANEVLDDLYGYLL